MKNVKKLTGAELWIDTDNGLYKIADCEALIKVSENVQTLKLPDTDVEYTVKSYSAALVICGNIKSDNCGNIDLNLLRSVRHFNLRFDAVETKIDECEMFVNEFKNIIPVEIDLNGEWRFDITSHLNSVKGLFPDLIFC